MKKGRLIGAALFCDAPGPLPRRSSLTLGERVVVSSAAYPGCDVPRKVAGGRSA